MGRGVKTHISHLVLSLVEVLGSATDSMQQCGIASFDKIRICHIMRAFPRNFVEIIKNYGLKTSNIFFVMKFLYSFRIFSLWNNEIIEENSSFVHCNFSQCQSTWRSLPQPIHAWVPV